MTNENKSLVVPFIAVTTLFLPGASSHRWSIR